MEIGAPWTYGEMLGNTDRLAIIRFCLTYGTRLKCSTRYLLRPIDTVDLEAAFEEKEAGYRANIERYRQELNDYKDGKPVDPEWKKRIEQYCDSDNPIEHYYNTIIEQEENIIDHIRKLYFINVDYLYKSENSLAFHSSMNPRVTFGYYNGLHEECDCLITDDIRESLLPSFKDGRPEHTTNSDYYHGAFDCDRSETYYEDLEIWCEDRIIMSTVSHESMFGISFDEKDMEAFRTFEGEIERNNRIIEVICSER